MVFIKSLFQTMADFIARNVLHKIICFNFHFEHFWKRLNTSWNLSIYTALGFWLWVKKLTIHCTTNLWKCHQLRQRIVKKPQPTVHVHFAFAFVWENFRARFSISDEKNVRKNGNGIKLIKVSFPWDLFTSFLHHDHSCVITFKSFHLKTVY